MSKEEAIEILSEMRSKYNLFGDEEEATRYHVLSWAIRAMNAEPVRHGRWQRERNPMRYQVVPYVFVCDQCGTAFEYDTPYCGECGAKMDEVEDG